MRPVLFYRLVHSFSSLFFFLFLLPSLVSAEGPPYINEIFVHPNSSQDEWVEIYNPERIDIKNYFLDDDTDFDSDEGSGGKKSLATIDTTNLLYPIFSVSSLFNNGGDFVVLFNASGETVDEYEYTDDPGVDIALGRESDGSDTWGVMKTPTKAGGNSGFFPTPTPTDEPTLTPTRTPSPTRTPTPTKKPTPSKTPTKTPTTKPGSSKNADSVGDTATASPTIKRDIPTSVLGLQTGKPTQSPSPTPVVKIGGASTVHPSVFSLCIGGLFIIAAGVTFYLSQRRTRTFS